LWGNSVFCFFFLKKEEFRGGFYFGSFSKRKGGREAMAGNLGARKLFSDIFINI